MDNITRYDKFLSISEPYTFLQFWVYFVKTLIFYRFHLFSMIDNEYEKKLQFEQLIELKVNELKKDILA